MSLPKPLFLLFLSLNIISSLFIYESNSQPKLVKILPPISLTSNQNISLNLNDYFQGFNLSFLFNDLKDPYISFSKNQPLSFSSINIFQSGFSKVSMIDERKVAILTSNQQIYTLNFQQNIDDFSCFGIDFMNLDSDFLCSNMIVFNNSRLLLDCQRKSNFSNLFFSISLDSEGRFLGNTSILSEIKPIYNNDTLRNTKYLDCEKMMEYENGILFRYCPENPNVTQDSSISGVIEVFHEKNNSLFESLEIIDEEKVRNQLLIVDLAIYQVSSKEKFSFFLLDEVMGPCTVKYENNSIKLINDFPEILGNRKFILKYLSQESMVLIVTSHYINEIQVDPENDEKTLQKRQNFGRDYLNVFNIHCNVQHTFVQVQDETQTFVEIFKRTSNNTDLLYKFSVSPSERYIYLENTMGSNDWLFFYDFSSNNYRFLTISQLIIEVSCCKNVIFNDFLPYFRELDFTVYNSDEFSNTKSEIAAQIIIIVNTTSITMQDSLGFRFYLMNPEEQFLEKEFFFQNEELPPLSVNSQKEMQTFQNDYLSLGIEENLNDSDLGISNSNRYGNSLPTNLLGSIMATKKKLPLLKVKEMQVSLNSNLSNEKVYENPLVLGFLKFDFMKTEVDSKGKLNLNYEENESFLIQTKLLYVEEEIYLDITPDFSSITVNFSNSFLNNLNNNVTTFDLNTQESLNLDGFFQGYIENYGFELDNQSNSSDFFIDTFIEKSDMKAFDNQLMNISNNPNSTNKILFSQNFGILLNDNKLVLMEIPPLRNFTKVSELDLANISTFFNYCDDFFIHDNLTIIVLICSIKHEDSKPKRLIFLNFDSNGFSNIVRQSPIPQYIDTISKLLFLENVLFIVEKLTDSLNESLIHIFSLEPSQLGNWSSLNNSRIIIDMNILNYKRLNAESLNVDYLLIYDFQVKTLGKLDDLLAFGIFMSDFYCLYYAEFTINFTIQPDNFVGNINKLSRLELKTLLGNYSHNLDLGYGFKWLESNEFGELKLLIFDEFDLMEIAVSRFNWETTTIVRNYQTFYSCFHKGMTQQNSEFLIDLCEVSEEGYQENNEVLLQLYVKYESNFSIISQSLNFSREELGNIDLNGSLLIIYLNNGTFLLYHLKTGISLRKNEEIYGNDMINGSFYGRNRYSEARVFVNIKPRILIYEKSNVGFYLLIVLPVIAAFLGIFALLVMIQWNRKKRKEILLEKYLKGHKTNLINGS